MKSFTKNILDIQPSQLYLSSKKLNRAEKYLDSVDSKEIEPLPVKKIDDQIFFTDGHTRAFVLYKKGVKKIKVYWEEEELDWLQYLVCVDWCKKSGINDISDLEERIISQKEYEKSWIDKCESMHRNIKNNSSKYIDFNEINNPDEKSEVCYKIIDNLDNWFGKEDANREYSQGVREDFFIAVKVGRIPIGFISIKDHNEFTAEVYVLGILKEFHKNGIGERLIELAQDKLIADNKKFLTVKTLSGTNPDKYYKRTRKFYKAMGFYPLEEMPELWSEEEPCLYMVKTLF